MRTEEDAGESDVCMCGKEAGEMEQGGEEFKPGQKETSPWPHPPSIVKLTKCGPGGTLGLLSGTMSLHQASIQDTGAQSWREELEEAGLGEVTEITLGVAGWGAEKDALEMQRP